MPDNIPFNPLLDIATDEITAANMLDVPGGSQPRLEAFYDTTGEDPLVFAELFLARLPVAAETPSALDLIERIKQQQETDPSTVIWVDSISNLGIDPHGPS